MDLDKAFLHQGFNILLTREPKEMLPSFNKVIPNPALSDVGYKAHVLLLQYLKENNIPYAVLDAKETLLNPEKVLKALCEKAGIPFTKQMLTWEKGARPEDGVWAPHWYNSVHNSTGFKSYEPKKEPFPSYLEPLLMEAKPYYDQLYQEAIKA